MRDERLHADNPAHCVISIRHPLTCSISSRNIRRYGALHRAKVGPFTSLIRTLFEIRLMPDAPHDRKQSFGQRIYCCLSAKPPSRDRA